MGPEALLSERFRIVARLGEGAYGTVYEALDCQREERVAVKLLHRVGGDAIFRFKQEFRTLRGMRHRNLVELGELIEDDGRFLFTMELVHGSDFLGHVRPPFSQAPLREAAHGAGRGQLDEGRLRSALAQLASGLSALHAAGKVHRDIKPTNVRVDPEGRVVLLDFGLSMDASDDSGSAAASLVGTAAYMSPEQAGSRPVTAASDWYSVGVLLYEALTGRRPFTGPALQVLFEKQRQPPAPPSVHVEGVPADLEALCMALLQADPAARPPGDAVVAALGAGATERARKGAWGFVGREAEMGALQRHLEALLAGQPEGGVYVCGEAGVGKSRLLDQWLVRVRRQHSAALVLRGRAHEAESLSFRAFDGVIDGLSHALRQMSDAQLERLLPDTGAGALTQVFPVLGRLNALRRRGAGQLLSRDPWMARSEAFDALRQLFRALARQRPLLIVLDDIHLCDSDSLQLLDRLMTSPPLPLLWVGSGAVPERCGTTVRRFIQDTLAPRPAQRIELTGMGVEEGAQYAAMLLRHDAHGWPDAHDEKLAERIARHGRGHPLFIRFLVRHGHREGQGGEVPELREALERRVRALGEEDRALLRLMAVSSAPLGEALLRVASGLGAGAVHRHLAELSRSALVAEAAAGEQRAHAISQDLVRRAVLDGTDAAQVRAAHEALARAYLEVEPGETEALAIHLSAAGQPERALHFAVIAAGTAFDSLAFDRSARLFRLALDLVPTEDSVRRRRLWARAGEALAAAGRARQAADAYLQATRGASDLELDGLRVRAAQQLMQAGDVAAGQRLMRELLARVGTRDPRTSLGTTLQLLYERTRLSLRGMDFESRSETWASAADLHATDLLWAATSMISMVDVARGFALQTRHLLKALDLGEPYRLARAIALEAQMLQSQQARPDSRATELFAKARMLAEQSGNPHAHALVSLGEGVAAANIGRFPQALALLDDAQATLRRRCRAATWELDNAQYHVAVVLMYLGRFGELNRRVPRQILEARERGDHYLEALLALSAGYWEPLLAGDVEQARALVARGQRMWPAAGFQSPRTLACVASVFIALCAEPAQARDVYARTYQSVEVEAVRRVPSLRVLLTVLGAQCELASSLHQPPGRARASLRRARRAAQRLGQHPLGYAPAFGALIAAAVAQRQGDSVRAVSLLIDAAAGFESHGMGLYAAASRYREGLLVGGDRGRAQMASALGGVVEQGIEPAEPLLRTAAPGFTES